MAGGWYDQDPQFIDEIMVIFEERGRHLEEEERRRKGSERPSSLVSGRRRPR